MSQPSGGTPFTSLSPVLAEGAPGNLAFHCPGCDYLHVLPTGPGTGARWGYNGNPAAPTFTPSVLVRTGKAYLPSAPEWEEGDPPLVCHSFVSNGRIQFLDDSTHHLAGQTVDLPEITV